MPEHGAPEARFSSRFFPRIRRQYNTRVAPGRSLMLPPSWISAIYTPTVSPFARSFPFAPSTLPLFIVTAAELYSPRKYYVHPVHDGGAAVSSQRLSAASKPGTDFEKTLRRLSASLSFLQLGISYAANYPDCANGFFEKFLRFCMICFGPLVLSRITERTSDEWWMSIRAYCRSPHTFDVSCFRISLYFTFHNANWRSFWVGTVYKFRAIHVYAPR